MLRERAPEVLKGEMLLLFYEVIISAMSINVIHFITAQRSHVLSQYARLTLDYQSGGRDGGNENPRTIRDFCEKQDIL